MELDLTQASECEKAVLRFEWSRPPWTLRPPDRLPPGALRAGRHLRTFTPHDAFVALPISMGSQELNLPVCALDRVHASWSPAHDLAHC